MTQLDHLARNWAPGKWNADEPQMLDVLTESWVAILSDASGHEQPAAGARPRDHGLVTTARECSG